MAFEDTRKTLCGAIGGDSLNQDCSSQSQWKDFGEGVCLVDQGHKGEESQYKWNSLDAWMPPETLKITRKASCGEGSDTWDHFQMRTHR